MPDAADATFLSVLTGSFSQGAADNPTVAVVEAAYRAAGIDARYVNCEVTPADLGAAVAGARAMGWAGFNCSIPHKVAVIEHLDALAESASIIGAVNCVVRRGDEMIGENTDGQGFLTSLRTVVDPAGTRVVVFGAGGAARAVAVELALAGASGITIVNRDRARGAELAALLGERTGCPASHVPWDARYALPAGTDIVVNATSVGLAPHGDRLIDIDPDSVVAAMVVADVIANPPRTALLAAAAERGATTLNGLDMLVNQAVLGIRLWTGVDPDADIMRDTLAAIFTG